MSPSVTEQLATPLVLVVPEQLSAPTLKLIVLPATPCELSLFVSFAERATESLKSPLVAPV
jgi:hypothetical protein